VHILVSNDDGYQAPGLGCLARALGKIARITVVAPDRNRSGASNSLTLDSPLRIHRADNGFYYVNGTPTDCVHLAITGLLEHEPDMVVAGINSGANLGDDVLYSGTVAAAVEGRFMGLPAIAVSLTGNEFKHYDTAAEVVLKLIARMGEQPLPTDSILNVNVPDIPWNDVRGFAATRLGNRHKAEPVIKAMDPRGNAVYWVGPAGPEQDAGEGTDFYAIRMQHVSVTPLQIDLTRHSALPPLRNWLEELPRP
jgi:5'-nucleotidase